MKARRRPAKVKQVASKRALWRLQAEELRRQTVQDGTPRSAVPMFDVKRWKRENL